MPLYESGEDYLEAILRLKLVKQEVHAVDVARELNFSKPSVSKALKNLKEDGYIDIIDNHIVLTDAGKAKAEAVYSRHKMITQFFVKLGVDADTAEADACKIEHDLSTQTVERMIEFLSKK